MQKTWNISSHADPESTLPGLSLYVLWNVHEDISYDILRNARLRRKGAFIAVRTLEGAGRIELQHRPPIEVLPGTLLFFNNRLLKRHATTQPNWRFWWFEFSLNGTIPFQLNQRLPVPVITAETGFLETIFTHLHSKQGFDRDYAASLFQMLLYRWLMYGERRQTTPHQRTVNRIVQMMHQRLHQVWHVRDMAREAGMSQSGFRQVFKSITGRSPKAFFEHLKLVAAREKLVMGMGSVKELADQFSYSSPFHFSRNFKKQFGKPPNHYLPNAPIKKPSRRTVSNN